MSIKLIKQVIDKNDLLSNGVFNYQIDDSELVSSYKEHLRKNVLIGKDSKVLGTYFHISDVHLNPLGRKPHARSDTFSYDLDAKFYVLGEFANALDIRAFILSGDVFHLKDQRLHTPETINHNKARIRSLNKPVYAIPGNHDLPKSSLDNYAKSAYSLIDELPCFTSFINPGDKIIDRIPLNDSFYLVGITGAPYFKLEEAKQKVPTYDTAFLDSEGLKTVNSQIFLAHIDAMPEDAPHLFWDTISFNQLFDLTPNSNIICMGHIHQSYDVIVRGHQMLSKPWSLTRVVNDLYSKEEVLEKKHVPGLAVITYFSFINEENGALCVGTDIHYMGLPCKPYKLAFEQEQVSRAIKKSEEIKTFIASLHEQFGDSKEAFKIYSPEDIRAKIVISEEVNQILSEYFGKVDARDK